MNFVEARDILTVHFLAYWNNRTPVETYNKKHTPVSGESWVRINVVNTASESPELGEDGSHTRKRVRGFIYVEVFLPAFKGGTDKTLVTDAEKAFQFKTIANEIFCRVATTQTAGKVAGGSWYMEFIPTPFWFDEIIQNGD